MEILANCMYFVGTRTGWSIPLPEHLKLCFLLIWRLWCARAGYGRREKKCCVETLPPAHTFPVCVCVRVWYWFICILGLHQFALLGLTGRAPAAWLRLVSAVVSCAPTEELVLGRQAFACPVPLVLFTSNSTSLFESFTLILMSSLTFPLLFELPHPLPSFKSVVVFIVCLLHCRLPAELPRARDHAFLTLGR